MSKFNLLSDVSTTPTFRGLTQSHVLCSLIESGQWRRVDTLQYLIPGFEEQQAEGGPYGVPILPPSTESTSGLLVKLIDYLEDLMHEEGFREIPLAMTKIML